MTQHAIILFPTLLPKVQTIENHLEINSHIQVSDVWSESILLISSK